jgi:hypothetical protein
LTILLPWIAGRTNADANEYTQCLNAIWSVINFEEAEKRIHRSLHLNLDVLQILGVAPVPNERTNERNQIPSSSSS